MKQGFITGEHGGHDCFPSSRSTSVLLSTSRTERSRSMGNHSGSSASSRHTSTSLSTRAGAWRLASQRRRWEAARVYFLLQLRSARVAAIALLLAFTATVHSTVIKQADHAFNQGRYDQAIQLWQQQQPENTVQQLEVQRRMASAYWQLGHFQAAQNRLESALALAEQHHNKHQQALVLNELSKLSLAKGDTHQAGDYLQPALTIARALNQPSVLAEVLNQQGNWLAVRYDYAGADAAYVEALSQAGAANRTLQAKIQVNRTQSLYQEALFYLDAGSDRTPIFQATIQQLQISLPLLTAWQDRYSQALALAKLGKLAGDIQAQFVQNQQTAPIVLETLALQALQASVQVAKQLDHPTAKAYAYGHLGEYYLRLQNHEKALRLTRQAVFFAQHSGVNELGYFLHRQLGQLFRQRGERMRAIRAYRRAVARFTPVRQRDAETGYCAKTAGFRERIAPVYFELADLLLQQARTDATNRQTLLREARDSIESFKSAEIQAYFQDDCIMVRRQSDAVDAWLDQHTAILYPIVLPDRLALLLGFQDGLFQASVPLKQAQLRKEALLLLSGLRHHPSPTTRSGDSVSNLVNCSPALRGATPLQASVATQQFYPHAQSLYRWLIQPLQQQLQNRGITTLVIAPDGVLRTIPFAALHDGKQFLIEQYALAVVPALTLSSKQTATQAAKRALLAGLSDASQGFSALPCVEYEIQHVSTLYQAQQDTLLNQRFRAAELRSILEQQPYNLLHIATHGQFKDNLQQTFLLTYDNKLRLNQLESLLKSNTNQHIDLLTLSACETAAGNDRAALGLAGIALKAGVDSALASLWKVDDMATPAVILAFYHQWQQAGVGKARALQQAQIKMLKEAGFARYRHPYYWAAFLLIGAWE